MVSRIRSGINPDDRIKAEAIAEIVAVIDEIDAHRTGKAPWA